MELLEEVAEPALAGVGVPEIAAEEPQGKFLREVIGGLRVAERGQQVAMDSASVSSHQRGLGFGGFRGPAIVGLENGRPMRLDPAEVVVKGFGIHSPASRGR